MNDPAGIIDMTRLVRDFALGAVNAQSFIDNYANFYYCEALDGHEDSSLLHAEERARLGPAVELHRRIQEEVVNQIALDAEALPEVLKMAGRVTASEARERALRICAEVGTEAVLLAIGPA